MEKYCLNCGESSTNKLCDKCQYYEDLDYESKKGNGPKGCSHSTSKWSCRVCNFDNYLYTIVLQRMRSALRKFNIRPQMEYLGCDIKTYAQYLEKLFETGMDWGNYGFYNHNWCIDHKIPFQHREYTMEETIRLCHYMNTQPMWAKKNREKWSNRCDALFEDIPQIPFTIISCDTPYISVFHTEEGRHAYYMEYREKNKEKWKTYYMNNKDKYIQTYKKYSTNKKVEEMRDIYSVLKSVCVFTGNNKDQVPSEVLTGLTGYSARKLVKPLIFLGCTKIRKRDIQYSSNSITFWCGLNII